MNLAIILFLFLQVPRFHLWWIQEVVSELGCARLWLVFWQNFVWCLTKCQRAQNLTFLNLTGKNLLCEKVEICVIIEKDNCVVALNGSQIKPKGMIYVQFAKIDEINQASILLTLEHKILSNVKIMDTIAKELWDNLNRM